MLSCGRRRIRVLRTTELPAKPDSAITPNAANRNVSSEAGVPMIDVAALVGAANAASDVKSASIFVAAFADATANEGDVGRAMAEEGMPIDTGHRDTTGDGEPSRVALFGRS